MADKFIKEFHFSWGCGIIVDQLDECWAIIIGQMFVELGYEKSHI